MPVLGPLLKSCLLLAAKICVQEPGFRLKPIKHLVVASLLLLHIRAADLRSFIDREQTIVSL